MEEDECWFSRFAQPQAHAWVEPGAELRLVQREAKRGETDKALACFGAVRHATEEVLLYFSDGQPNSLQMWLFIIALLAQALYQVSPGYNLTNIWTWVQTGAGYTPAIGDFGVTSASTLELLLRYMVAWFVGLMTIAQIIFRRQNIA